MVDVQYLVKHPSALNLCYLVVDSGNQGLTASEASRILGLAIQTVTNSLRDLERKKILKSTKQGVQRRYWAVNRDTLTSAVDEALSVIGKSRIRGRIIPLHILLRNVGVELERSLRGKKDIELAKDVSLDSLPLGVKLEFQLQKRGMPLFSIIISKISNVNDMLATLGKVLLVTTSKNLGSLIVFIVIDYSMMAARFEQNFTIIESKLKQLMDPRATIETYQTWDPVIMQPGFAKEEIVQRILDHISKLD